MVAADSQPFMFENTLLLDPDVFGALSAEPIMYLVRHISFAPPIQALPSRVKLRNQSCLRG
jgi:hypothetical protein